ncbi:sentrin-specific protease 2-like [Ruditapes philippinarum]|uniref:sentrin-specific protease 2-like n=1 Tax=Ruditapes philippinarum TaxID=129788 RepID=UPI00295A908A|nr:sentrin-specific protease 2-like [Ruditapes philippinarum]
MNDELSFLEDVPPETLIAQISRHNVLQEDMERLLCLENIRKAWLNDQIINAYLKLIENAAEKVGVLDVYFFTSILDCKETAKHYIKDMHRGKDIILIPACNKGRDHWTLLVVDLKKDSVIVVDSMRSKTNPGVILIEYMRKNPLLGKNKVWTINVLKGLPKQQNGCDCGIFMCQNAVKMAFDLPQFVVQEEIHWIRRAMAVEILTGRLMPRI